MSDAKEVINVIKGDMDWSISSVVIDILIIVSSFVSIKFNCIRKEFKFPTHRLAKYNFVSEYNLSGLSDWTLSKGIVVVCFLIINEIPLPRGKKIKKTNKQANDLIWAQVIEIIIYI